MKKLCAERMDYDKNRWDWNTGFWQDADAKYDRILFSVKYADASGLFKDLDIWKEKEYRSLQGTYPVISLSFAGVKDPITQAPEKGINREIAVKNHGG